MWIPGTLFSLGSHPGDGSLGHLDVKKLARIVKLGHRMTGNRRDTTDGAGWEYAHVAIDDASRSPGRSRS